MWRKVHRLDLSCLCLNSADSLYFIVVQSLNLKILWSIMINKLYECTRVFLNIFRNLYLEIQSFIEVENSKWISVYSPFRFCNTLEFAVILNHPIKLLEIWALRCTNSVNPRINTLVSQSFRIHNHLE